MARFQFGGAMAGWLVVDVDASTLFPGEEGGVRLVAIPNDNIELTVYDAEDGNPVTDLLDANESTISVVTVLAGNPYIPLFYGPDEVSELWVEAVDSNGGSLGWFQVPRPGGGGGSGGASSWDEITGKPTFAAVALTGAYADLSGKPSIPTTAEQIGAAPQVHTHVIGAVTGLQSALDGKARSTGAVTVARGSSGTWPSRGSEAHTSWVDTDVADPQVPPGMAVGDLYIGPDGMTGLEPGESPA